jgi:hypothetical protein
MMFDTDAENMGIPDGNPLTQAELNELLGNRPNSRAAFRMRQEGVGPPFIRTGRKHSRILYPRPGVRAWMLDRLFTSQSEANEVTG